MNHPFDEFSKSLSEPVPPRIVAPAGGNCRWRGVRAIGARAGNRRGEPGRTIKAKTPTQDDAQVARSLRQERCVHHVLQTLQNDAAAEPMLDGLSVVQQQPESSQWLVWKLCVLRIRNDVLSRPLRELQQRLQQLWRLWKKLPGGNELRQREVQIQWRRQ